MVTNELPDRVCRASDSTFLLASWACLLSLVNPFFDFAAGKVLLTLIWSYWLLTGRQLGTFLALAAVSALVPLIIDHPSTLTWWSVWLPLLLVLGYFSREKLHRIQFIGPFTYVFLILGLGAGLYLSFYMSLSLTILLCAAGAGFTLSRTRLWRGLSLGSLTLVGALMFFHWQPLAKGLRWNEWGNPSLLAFYSSEPKIWRHFSKVKESVPLVPYQSLVKNLYSLVYGTEGFLFSDGGYKSYHSGYKILFFAQKWVQFLGEGQKVHFHHILTQDLCRLIQPIREHIELYQTVSRGFSPHCGQRRLPRQSVRHFIAVEPYEKLPGPPKPEGLNWSRWRCFQDRLPEDWYQKMARDQKTVLRLDQGLSLSPQQIDSGKYVFRLSFVDISCEVTAGSGFFAGIQPLESDLIARQFRIWQDWNEEL